MQPSAFILSDSDHKYGYSNDNKNPSQYALSKRKTNTIHIRRVSTKRSNHHNNNNIPYYRDPVIAPLSALFHNLNLDKLYLDNIDIDNLVHHLTPQLLSQFLNQQGFNVNPSLFQSIASSDLQSMLNDTQLIAFLKHKLAHPTHAYCISSIVLNNKNTKQIKEQQSDDKKYNKQISNDSSLLISPSIYVSPYSNHTVSTSIKSPTSPPSPIKVSSSLSSSSKSPQSTEIIRSILKGIQHVMLYHTNRTIHDANVYINTKHGSVHIEDEELRKECMETTKIKEENGEFEFEEYAHRIFDLLRRKFDLKSFKYLYKLFGIELINNKKGKNIVDIEYATKHFWKPLITNSKSGQLLYRSKDDLFIIKELKYDEWYFLRHSFLFQYFRYMQSNIDSLLSKILGVYRINDIYFMTMKNVHYTPLQSVTLHKVYDLKGSTHKRRATRHKLVLDKNDFSALTIIESTSGYMEMEERLNEEEEETIDNIRHKYSPSWYQPTVNEDSSNIKVIKSDTLQCTQQNAFAFDGISNEHQNISTKHKAHNEKYSGELSNIEVWKRSKILKDLDWIQDEQIIKIGKIRSSFLFGQLDKDMKFLMRMNVMDYSLLVGMHFRGKNNDKINVDNDDRWTVGKLFVYENGGMSYDKSEEENDKLNIIKHKKEHIPQKDAIYYCGIIDFLQVYTAKKKVETLVKGLAHNKNSISAIDPDSYAKRLYAFVQKSVE